MLAGNYVASASWHSLASTGSSQHQLLANLSAVFLKGVSDRQAEQTDRPDQTDQTDRQTNFRKSLKASLRKPLEIHS